MPGTHFLPNFQGLAQTLYGPERPAGGQLVAAVDLAARGSRDRSVAQLMHRAESGQITLLPGRSLGKSQARNLERQMQRELQRMHRGVEERSMLDGLCFTSTPLSSENPLFTEWSAISTNPASTVHGPQESMVEHLSRLQRQWNESPTIIETEPPAVPAPAPRPSLNEQVEAARERIASHVEWALGQLRGGSVLVGTLNDITYFIRDVIDRGAGPGVIVNRRYQLGACVPPTGARSLYLEDFPVGGLVAMHRVLLSFYDPQDQVGARAAPHATPAGEPVGDLDRPLTFEE